MNQPYADRADDHIRAILELCGLPRPPAPLPVEPAVRKFHLASIRLALEHAN
jgi:hypothetical protein